MKRIGKTIKEKCRNGSSFLKFTLLFEAILIVSLTFVMVFATQRFSAILREKEIALGEKRLDNLADFAQEEYNRIYSLKNYMHNGGVSEIMAKISREEQAAYEYKNIQDIQVFFSGISYADENISDVILVSSRGNVYSYTRQASYEVNPSYPFMEEEEMRRFLSSEEDMEIRYADPSRYCIRERETVVSYIGKIFDASLFPQKKVVGVFIINIPLSSFENIQNNNAEAGQGNLYLVSKENRILYCTDKTECGQIMDIPSQMEHNRIYTMTRNLGSSGISVYYILLQKVLLSRITAIRNQVLVVLAAAIIGTMILGYILYRIFQKKMNILLESMQELQQGNFRTRLPVDSQDEIGKISESFNEMCEKLNAYVGRVYKAEIQRKNAEMNALQTQINPHFLYNTLESIKSKALVNEDEDTAAMITILGNLFRWISRTNEKTVSLEEELEYVRNYLKLQSYRYNKKLEVHIDVEEGFLDYEVPKLILQPLIENAVKYALDEVPGDKLLGIQIRKKETILEITVYDNGKGIKKEKLQKINENLKIVEAQDDFESIGLGNVNQRLKLMYGQEYGLQIKSIENYGTAVKVKIPIMDVGDK